MTASVQLGERKTFRWVVVLVFAGLFAASLAGLRIEWDVLFGERARANASRFASEAWPPVTSWEFVAPLFALALDTICVAALATGVAALLGFPLGVLGSRTAVLGALFVSGDVEPRWWQRALYLVARVVGAVFRSVPELIWALLFVRVFGLGGAPAVMAIGIAYGGMLAKVYSEQLEGIGAQPVVALEALGARTSGAFLFGVLPQASVAMASYTFYRFECAVRATALMGLVGAGGLATKIHTSIDCSAYGEVVTEAGVLMLIVVVVEWASDAIRARIG